MSPLNTSNPLALQVLMSETIFDIGFSFISSSEEILKEPVALKEQQFAFKSYGSNKKNILFITLDAQHEYFSKDAELAFLKTLKALKLALEDVAVINCKEPFHNQTFKQIKKEFKPRNCIFLGVDPEKLGQANFAENVLKMEDGVQFLYSSSFEEMLVDAKKKRIFWDAIKLMNF